MLMKNPGFEWEPDPRVPKDRRTPGLWLQAIAYVGIGISIAVLYSGCMILLIRWLVAHYVDAIRMPPFG